MKPKKDNVTYINDFNKKINKKKLIIAGILGAIILIWLICFIIYAFNAQFRMFCDIYIFRKEIDENNATQVKISDINVSNVFAFSNYIAVIKDNVMTKYNSAGNEESTLKIEITKPLIDTNGNYAAIAEKLGQKIYLVKNNEIVWENTLSGNISTVDVNENGYVSVILSGTSYKSVIILYDENGNELFKTYLSNTIAISSEISSDNKYLSFAEVNTSGTLIQSNIKIISIEKAKQMPADAVIYTYKANENSLVTNIKYHKNRLVCMYEDSIQKIENNENKEVTLLKENNKKITFADINLFDTALKIVENNEGLFNTKTEVQLINTSSLKSSVYNVEGAVKSVNCYGNRISINLGAEVHFIDSNGWLIKKYVSTQEIRGIAMNNKIAGIIYKNKIDIINL